MTKSRYQSGRGIAICCIAAGGAIASLPLAALAQQTRSKGETSVIIPGSELENYLRYLQSSGAVPLTGFAIRQLSTQQSAALFPVGKNPWENRLTSPIGGESSLQMTLFPVGVSAKINSGFPAGVNDGAVWAGRGMTFAADGGGLLKAGPFVLQLNPILFWAQNASFDLQPNGQSGKKLYSAGQPQYATSIDLPQRFGSSSYGRVDIGESEVRAEFPWFMAGASNAHRLWGPASEYPFILGRNAAGFPHLFVSTNDPLNLGFAHLEANVLWGALSQSEFSPVTGSQDYFSVIEPGTRRFASGLALSFSPRGVDGLNIGVSRFLHSLWPRSGIPQAYFTKVLQNFLKRSLQEKGSDAASDPRSSDNQLLSVFARWVLPKRGSEFYFEFGREDHAYDFRDLVSEPDHSRSYMLGARQVLGRSEKSFSAVRLELINFQIPETARHRDEGGIYLHSLLRQGHTQNGQLLGAPVGPGAAAASTVGYDRYSTGGRLSVVWTRTVNQEAGRFWLTGLSNESTIDATHSLSVERLFSRGPVDITATGTLAREFNRNFGSDALNLGASISARYNLR